MARDPVMDVLREFVAVESTPDAGPRGILERAASEVRDLGLVPRIDRRLGTITATHGRGGVLFNGHLDTVPIGSGWKVKTGTIRGGRLYGRGTADMKAGCVAALAAARELLKRDIAFSLLFTTDEETTMAAAKAVMATPLIRGASAVVVGEPSSLAPFVEEKGVYWFDAIASGHAAHGSLPHLGESAILNARHLLERIAPYSRPHDVLRELTINPGRIYGGTKTNVVADSCTVELDARYPARMTPQTVRAKLRRLAGTDLRLVERHHVPAARVNPRSRHVRLLATLGRSRAGAVTFATEMAWYSQHNPRCVIFGPGSPAQCHVANEFVPIAEVRRCARIYTAFAAEMASE